MAGLSFHLDRGLAGLPAFRAEVKRLAGGRAQFELGSDDATAAAAAERGTSLQALALLLFGIIVALAMLVIVGQSVARLALTAAEDFPVLRALGCSRAQLGAVALAPGALVAAAGMALAIPAAYALSVFTPIGLARRAEISPGFAFDAPVLLGGAVLLTLLLTARTALTAQRVARKAETTVAERGRGSRIARWMARRGFPVPAVAGVRLAFEPGSDPTAVPIRSAVLGTVLALAAVMAALVFGASLAHVIGDPRLAGWNWDVAVGNPHSGDTAAQTIPKLRANASLAGFTATALGDGDIGGRDVPVVGIQPLRGRVAPPLLDGRLPRGPREIALSGGELRALHTGVGGLVRARTTRGMVALRITGQIVLSPEITNEQVKLGTGGVMTLAGAQTLSRTPLPVNVYLVRLRHPGDPAAIARLKRQFPGVVLPAVPPPEVRELQGVNGLPLVLACALTLLAAGTIAHTLVTLGAPAAPGPGDPQGDGVHQPAGPGHSGLAGHRDRRDGPGHRAAAGGSCRALGLDPAGPRVRDRAGAGHLSTRAAVGARRPAHGQPGRGGARARRGAHPARRGAPGRISGAPPPPRPRQPRPSAPHHAPPAPCATLMSGRPTYHVCGAPEPDKTHASMHLLRDMWPSSPAQGRVWWLVAGKNSGKRPGEVDMERDPRTAGEPGQDAGVLGSETGGSDELGPEAGGTDVLGPEEGGTDELGPEAGGTDELGPEPGGTDVLGPPGR